MCPCQQEKDNKPERKADKPKPSKPTRTRQAGGPGDDDGPPPAIIVGRPRPVFTPRFTPRPSYPMRGQGGYPTGAQGYKRY
jgi:hypothetical protein